MVSQVRTRNGVTKRTSTLATNEFEKFEIADKKPRTLHNPNVSKTAKENAARVLQETYGEQNPYETPSRRGSASSEESEGGGDGGGRSFGKYGSEPVPSSRGGERNRTNVVRGLKAYVSLNPWPLTVNTGQEGALSDWQMANLALKI